MPQSPYTYPRFEAPHRLSMGLAALDPQEPWLVIDADYLDDLREKRRLLEQRRDDVFAELPASRHGQREALGLVAHELKTRHGIEVDGRDQRDEAPLLRAALSVQEDLCLMERDAAGQWLMTAAVVCFPTRWHMPSKLGMPLTQIHERVPEYEAVLSQSADRFFERLKQGRVFWRTNWSLFDDPALFQPGGKMRTEKNLAIDAGNAGERVWIRMERQTLCRLPESNAVLFGIRVFRTPLCQLESDPDSADTLAACLRSMSPEFQLYKSLPPIREAVLEYLGRIGGASS